MSLRSDFLDSVGELYTEDDFRHSGDALEVENREPSGHGRYAIGKISLKEAAKKAQAAGLVYAKSVAKVPVNTVRTILRNRLRTGQFEWNSKLIQGNSRSRLESDRRRRVAGTSSAAAFLMETNIVGLQTGKS